MSRPTTHSTSSTTPSDNAFCPPPSPTMDECINTILERLEQPDQRFISLLERLEERLTDTDSRLSTIERNHQILSDSVRDLTESSLFPVNSTPSMNPDDLEYFIQAKFNATYQTTLDSISRLSASVAELHLRQTDPTASSLTPSRSKGFFQKES